MINGKGASKRKAIAVLDTLTIPDPWDARALVDHVADRRDRPIVLTPVPAQALDDKVCGLWVNTANEDLLLYSEEAPRWHSDIVIGHELSHMLLGHDLPAAGAAPAFAVDPLTLAEWLPNLDPAAVTMVMGRSSYSSSHEFEAEYLATLMLDRASGRSVRGDTRARRMLTTFVPEGRR